MAVAVAAPTIATGAAPHHNLVSTSSSNTTTTIAGASSNAAAGSGSGSGSVTIKLAYNDSVHRFVVPDPWFHTVTSASSLAHTHHPPPNPAASGVGPWQRLLALLSRTLRVSPAEVATLGVYCEDADDDFVVPITNDDELRRCLELSTSSSSSSGGNHKTLKLFISHDAPASPPRASALAAAAKQPPPNGKSSAPTTAPAASASSSSASAPPIIVRATSGVPASLKRGAGDDKEQFEADTEAAIAAAAEAALDAAALEGAEVIEPEEDSGERGFGSILHGGSQIAVADYFGGGSSGGGVAAAPLSSFTAAAPTASSSSSAVAATNGADVQVTSGWGMIQVMDSHFGGDTASPRNHNSSNAHNRNGSKTTAVTTAATGIVDAKRGVVFTSGGPFPGVTAPITSTASSSATFIPTATDPWPRSLSHPRRAPTLAAFATSASASSSSSSSASTSHGRNSSAANGGRRVRTAWDTQWICAVPFLPASATSHTSALSSPPSASRVVSTAPSSAATSSASSSASAVITAGLFGTATAASAAASAQAVAAQAALRGVYARFVASPKTLADGQVVITSRFASSVVPSAPVVQHWTFRNTGARAWPPNTRLVYCNGNVHDTPFPPVAIPSIAPGQQCTIALTVHLPAGATGRFWGVYRLCAGSVVGTVGGGNSSTSAAGAFTTAAADDQDSGRFGDCVRLDVSAKTESQLIAERATASTTAAAKRMLIEPAPAPVVAAAAASPFARWI